MAPGTFLPENNTFLIPEATLGSYFVTAGGIQNAVPYTSQKGHVGIMATWSTFEPDDPKSTTHELDERFEHERFIGKSQARESELNTMDYCYEYGRLDHENSREFPHSLPFRDVRESDGTKMIIIHSDGEDDTTAPFPSDQELQQGSFDRLDPMNYRSQIHDFFYEENEREDEYMRVCSSSLSKHRPSKWWPIAESAELRRNRPLSWHMEEQTTSQSPPRKHNARSKNVIFTRGSVKENENPQKFNTNFESDHGRLKKEDALETTGRFSQRKPARTHNYPEPISRPTSVREHNHPGSAGIPHNLGPTRDTYESTKKYNYVTSVPEDDLPGRTSQNRDSRELGEAYIHRCPFHHCSHVRDTAHSQFQGSVQNFKLPLKPQPPERPAQLTEKPRFSKPLPVSRNPTASSPVTCRLSPTLSEPTSQSPSPALLSEPQSWLPSPPQLNFPNDLKPSTVLQGRGGAYEPEFPRGFAPCIPTMLPSHSPPQPSISSPSCPSPTRSTQSILNAAHEHYDGIPGATINTQLSEDFKNNIDDKNSENDNISSKPHCKEIFVNKYSNVGDTLQHETRSPKDTVAEQPSCHTPSKRSSNRDMENSFPVFRFTESPLGMTGPESVKTLENGAENLEPMAEKVRTRNEGHQDKSSPSLYIDDGGPDGTEPDNTGRDPVSGSEYSVNFSSEWEHNEGTSRNLLNVRVPLTSSLSGATKVGLNSMQALNLTQRDSGRCHGGVSTGHPRGARASKSSSGELRRASKTMSPKTDCDSKKPTETTKLSKPALTEVTDSFRKKAIEYIVMQLSGHVSHTCCAAVPCTGNGCTGNGCTGNGCTGNGCTDTSFSCTGTSSACTGCTDTVCIGTSSSSCTSCTDIGSTRKDCRSTDSRCNDCKNTDFRCIDCRSTDSRCIDCRSTDSKCIDCRSTDSRCIDCRSTDSRCIDCRSTDSRCVNCRSTDSRCIDCRSTDFMCIECRSTDSRSIDSKCTDCSEIHNTNHRSSSHTKISTEDLPTSDSSSCSCSNTRAHSSNTADHWSNTASNTRGHSCNTAGNTAGPTPGAHHDAASDHTPTASGTPGKERPPNSRMTTPAPAGNTLAAPGSPAARSHRMMGPQASSGSVFEASAPHISRVPSAEAGASSAAVNTTAISGNVSAAAQSLSSTVTMPSSAINATPAAVNTQPPDVNTSVNTSLTAHRPPAAVNTSLPAVNTPPAPVNTPSLQRLYKTVSRLEHTVFTAAKGDKESYMRHLAGKLATVYCQLQYTQQLAVPPGGPSATDRTNATGNRTAKTRAQLGGTNWQCGTHPIEPN